MTRSLASAHRVAEILDEPVALTSPENAITEIPDGGIRFEHVSFKYHPDAAAYALADIDLAIQPGRPSAFWAAPVRPRRRWCS